MSYLPENYPASSETVTFQEAIQPEIGELWRLRDEFLQQLNPYTATWGLPLWEKALGLKVSSGLEIDVRRRAVVAKLQGLGTTTVKVVQDLAETLLGVPVEVFEYYSEYRVELAVEGGFRPGPWMGPLKAQLDQIMPAHLGWGFFIQLPVSITLTPHLGPRMSVSTLPQYHPAVPPVKLCPHPRLGPRATTVRLPKMADQEGG